MPYNAYIPTLNDVINTQVAGEKLPKLEMGQRDKDNSLNELCSLRAELMPTVNKFAADEAIYYIKWALGNTNGLGYGFMGHDGNWDSDITYEYLREIRFILLQVEKEILPNDISSQMILSCVLSKLSTQLAIKSDTDTYTSQFFTKAKKINDPLYIAIALRYRLDYEEWDLYGQTGGESIIKNMHGGKLTVGPSVLIKHLSSLQTLLQKSKEFINYAEKCEDLHLIYDSYKRCINIYMEIATMPNPYGDDADYANQDEIHQYDELEIESLCESEPSWLRRFSKILGLRMYDKMNEFSKHC